MDKQVKLIDADKVQNWIDVEFDKKFPNDCYGYADGRQSILDKLESKINDGSFDPDPIPPTIKPGDKVVYSEKPRYGIGEVVRLTALVDFRNFECACDISDLEVSHD